MKKKLSALCALFVLPVLLFLLFLAIPQPAMAQTCQITINPLTGLPDCKTGAGSTGMTAPGSNGMVGWNGTATVARSITAGTGVTVTNGDGVSANPTVAADTAVVLSRATDQAGTDTYCRSTTGNDTYTCTLTPTLTAYTRGGCLTLDADTANTGTATVNVDTIGAKSILSRSGGALSDSDIPANRPVRMCYDGTQFIVQGATSGGGTTPYTYAVVNSTGISMDGTDKVVATFSSVPALAAGACYTFNVAYINSGAAFTAKIKVDGTEVYTPSSSFGAGAEWHFYTAKYCNTSGQSTQRWVQTDSRYSSNVTYGNGWSSYIGASNVFLAATNNIDWSTSHTVTIVANAASGTFTVGLAELKQ